jgi:hypothetical protein
MGSFSKQLFLISCGGILLGGYLLWIIAPVADRAAVELAKSLLLPNTQGVFPEPQDRFMYVGITAIGGLTLLAVAVLRIGLNISQIAQRSFFGAS